MVHPNRRVRVYDAEEIARNYRETFTDKESLHKEELPFTWPEVWQHVGDSLAVAYASDKWKPDGDYELYKHLAESRNRALIVPEFLHDFYDRGRKWPTIGPYVSLADVPMPKHFALLALFEEIDLQLHVAGTNEHPSLGKKGDGVVKVTIKHGLLGGCQIRWSEVDAARDDEPFLVVYSESDGPCILVFGEKLEILADGIVG